MNLDMMSMKNFQCGVFVYWYLVLERFWRLACIKPFLFFKDIVKIFPLVPIGCLSDHWFGHSKNRPTLEHAGNQITLQFLCTLRFHIRLTKNGV